MRNKKVAWYACIVLILTFSFVSEGLCDNDNPNQMNGLFKQKWNAYEKANVDTVVTYFRDVVDGRNTNLVLDLFTDDCVIYRNDTPTTIGNVAFKAVLDNVLLAQYASVTTTIKDVVANGNEVFVYISHEAFVADRGAGSGINTALGFIALAPGTPINWFSMVLWKFDENSKATYELAFPDSLGQLINNGINLQVVP